MGTNSTSLRAFEYWTYLYHTQNEIAWRIPTLKTTSPHQKVPASSVSSPAAQVASAKQRFAPSQPKHPALPSTSSAAMKPKLLKLSRKAVHCTHKAQNSITFLKADLTLLKNVDKVSEEIKQREYRIDVMFMSQGYLTLQGRSGKPEHPLPPSVVAQPPLPDDARHLRRHRRPNVSPLLLPNALPTQPPPPPAASKPTTRALDLRTRP